MTCRTGTVRSSDCSAACWFSAVAALIRNQPSRANHSQVYSRRARTRYAAPTTRAHPNTCPDRADQAAALSLSPVMRHRTARSSRPPSSGAAGITLNTARMTLMPPSQASAATTTPPTPDACSSQASSKNTAPKTRLTSGPTPATRTSAAGSGISPCSRDTPPSNHKVMPSTLRPLRRATSEWASSWASSDPM